MFESLPFVKDPDASKKTFPEDLTIQMYNFKSQNKPFIVFEPGNSMSYVKDRRVQPKRKSLPACNGR